MKLYIIKVSSRDNNIITKEVSITMIIEFFDKPAPQKREDLHIVCVQDFDDEYHKDFYDPDDKLMSAVRMIRRRYKSTIEYQYAINILNNYIARLMVKHGGEDRFVSLLRAGLIDEYLPPMPRMKAGTKNKFLVKNKIVLSNASFKKLNIDRLMDLTDAYSDRDDAPTKLVYAEKDDKQVGEVNELIEKRGVDRVSTSYTKRMTVDLFEEYFLNRDRKKAKHVEEELTDLTVRDILDPNYEENVIDSDTFEQDEFIPYRGGFIHRDDVVTVENISKLGNLGWNQLALTRRVKGSKNILKITKNEERRSKKNKKKRQQAGDAFLLHLAGESDRHSSFGDFEDAMLSFTADSFNKE